MAYSATLTIGIPTYNGSAYIHNALDSAIKQISEGFESRVDVLISDNASTDGVMEIIRTYQAKQPIHIQYSRNEHNLGFDRNVDRLFKIASGQYVWMLGDDDVLEDGALRHVLSLLDQHHDLKAIQVNFDKYDKKLERIVQKVEIPEDLYCHDAEVFLANSKGRWGALSSLIIEKDAWNKVDLSNAFGSQVIFAYALFKILLLGDSYIVKQPLVKVREGSEKAVSHGDGDALLSIALASGTLYSSMKEMGYGPNIIRWHLSKDRPYVYSAIPLAKFWGIKNKLAITSKLIAIHNSPILWLKYIPVIYFPDFIFRKLYPLKKGVSSKMRVVKRKLKEFFNKAN